MSYAFSTYRRHRSKLRQMSWQEKGTATDRLILCIDPDSVEFLKLKAEAAGISLSGLCARILKAYIGAVRNREAN